MITYFRVKRDDVGFYKKKPLSKTRSTTLSPEKHVFPSLVKDDILIFKNEEKSIPTIENDIIINKSVTTLSPKGWLNVQRLKDEKSGYVDYRYLEVIQFDPVNNVILSSLSDVKKLAITKTLVELLQSFKTGEKIDNVDLLKRMVPVRNGKTTVLVPRESLISSILRLLQATTNKAPAEDFAEIMYNLKDLDVMSVLLNCLDVDHVDKYPLVVTKIIYSLTFSELINLIRVQELKEIVTTYHELHKYIRRALNKTKKPQDLTNVDKWRKILNKLKALKLDTLKHDPVTQAISVSLHEKLQVQYHVDVYFRMRKKELEFWFKNKNDNQLLWMLLDIILLGDAVQQILFADKLTNDWLMIFDFLISTVAFKFEIKLNIKELVLFFRSPHPIEAPPSLYLTLDHGKGYAVEAEAPASPAKMVIDLFTYDTSVSPFKPILKKKPDVAPPPQPSGTKKNVGIPEITDSRLSQAKVILPYIGDRVRDFIYDDIPHVFTSQLVPTIHKINRSLNRYIKPYVYNNLGAGVTGKFDKDTTAEMLNKNGSKHDAANAIDILGLVRIWYYELGSTSLGTSGSTKSLINENKLIFEKESKMFSYLERHPLYTEVIVPYAIARTNDDDWTPFTLFFHYNPTAFSRALKSYDAIINFLGSFTLVVTPKKAPPGSLTQANMLEFKMDNDLSLESSTRFRAKTGIVIGQVIESHERNVNAYFATKKRYSESVVELGGTFRSGWEWSYPFHSQ